MTIQIKFGSYDLNDTDREVTAYSEKLDTKKVSSAKLGVEGVHSPEATVGGREVTIRGRLVNDDQDTLVANLSALRLALFDGKQSLYLQDDKYYADMQIKPNGYRDWFLEGMQAAEYKATFTNEDPNKKKTTESNDSEGVSPLHSWTITTGGNAFLRPKLTFTSTENKNGAYITVENQTTGRTAKVGPIDVSVGDVIIIDCSARTVKQNGTLIMSHIDISHIFISMVAGANQMRWGAGTPQGTLLSVWREEWR